jgi:hypothetical protein
VIAAAVIAFAGLELLLKLERPLASTAARRRAGAPAEVRRRRSRLAVGRRLRAGPNPAGRQRTV